MKRATSAWYWLVLLGTANAAAQDLQGFEIPEELKGSLQQACPPGSEKDAQGVCQPKSPPPPAPAPPASAPPVQAPASSASPPATAEPPTPPRAERPALKPEVPETAPPAEQPAPAAPVPAEPSPPPPATAEQPAPSPPAEEGSAAEAVEEKPATPSEKEKEPSPAAPFVKGELADFIGSNKLVTQNNRVGVCFGYRKVDLKHYATITPEADFRIWKLEVGLSVPLAIEIFDGTWDLTKNGTVGFDDAGSFRREDWNETGEYVRFLRYLRFGHKEDNIFLDFSQYASTTIGHGALMRRYNVNVDPDSTRLSFELDMYNDYGGFELVGNSIVDWDLFGVLGFVKPLSFFMEGTLPRSLSLGVTYLADRHAPVELATQTTPSPNVFYLMGTDQPEVVSSAFLQALGVDMELKVLKSEHVDLKPYVDYSWFMPGTPSGANPPQVSGGGGLTLGLLGRFNFGKDPVHALRAIAEFRSFSATYLPSYFDTFYEVRKFLAHTDYRAAAQQPGGGLPHTKFKDVFVDRRGQGRHLGFYLEFNYALVSKAALTLAWEGADADLGNGFLAHLEVPALGWLQFFASYHHRGLDGPGEIFGAGGDRIVFAAARLRALPFLFFNARYYHTFELREDYQDPDGDGLEGTVRLYQTTHGWSVDVELGWEF